MGEQTRRLNDLERDHDSFCEQVRQMAGDTTTTYTPANKSYDELLRKQLRDGDKVLDNPIFPRNESFSRLNNRSNEININHTAGSGSSIMNQNIEDKLFFLDRKVNDMQKLLNRSAQRENEMLSIIKDLEARQSELFRAIVQLNDRNERNMDRILNSISSISKQRQIQSSLTNGYSSRNMLDDDERSSYNEYEPLDDNNSINSSKNFTK
ncbi:hypothetical protein TBLA_0J00480 [Henningerozyma blattae CBS 6284]|uniref:Spindle pole component 29 n=1 Tax=Henningerozyma blattae (strain ATCC 34711 / CBS 6284 / DSM 70876 / NBRC 10599 / NRRL Y-10934 / UCD 77-7) TaxID=1071380 RepID=I2H9J6_HENB6|nr:hypothetical protein TBLA_0J00480 [Tetrapisispora blattae CBS 6284]CCH63048.1 hypothetical protein TBLA_0J00480 [Tetrapisispora blattae CBS 6284]